MTQKCMVWRVKYKMPGPLSWVTVWALAVQIITKRETKKFRLGTQTLTQTGISFHVKETLTASNNNKNKKKE